MFDPNKPPATLAEMLQRSFAAHAQNSCLGSKPHAGQNRRKSSGEYSYTTYEAIAARVKSVAGGLQSLELERGQRAAILAENRPEWAIFDMACQMLGVISVPFFSTLPAAQVKGLLEDSGACLILVSDQSQWKKIREIWADLPELKHVVVMDEAPLDDWLQDAANAPQHLLYSDLETRGAEYFEANPGSYEMTWPAAAANDVATIIYTSGTTGVPKGVMLSQRNIIANIEAIIEAIKFTSDDRFLSFLPLAHVYERTAGFYLPLRIGASIAYCESLFTVADNLREARPTLMFCVPRLYEVMRDKLFGVAATLPEGQQRKYLDALELAQKAGAEKGRLPGAPGLGFVEKIKYKVYDAMLYSKVRERYGGRLRAFVSGGAPMAPELGALFIGLGLEILEGYGLTETAPVIAVNRPGQPRLGTVGPPLGCLEVQIAGDSEILVKGASITPGYWNKPQETREAIDEEGWFHTGDLGAMVDGHLKITGRKKDLLVLANGKKVAPAPIELRLTQSKYVDQVVLLGDDQKSVSALIVPNLDAVREYAAKNNLGIVEEDALLKADAVRRLFRQEIDGLSDDLAEFERIRNFELLQEPFSVEKGEMTPTLKIKRNVVAEKYGALVTV